MLKMLDHMTMKPITTLFCASKHSINLEKKKCLTILG